MPRTTNKDFFDQTKGFLASFNQVLEDGFFIDFLAEVRGFEGVGTTNIHIKAQGHLPNKKKWMEPGVIPFVDPVKVIETVRQQLRTSKCILEHRNCEVKTEDWNEYREVAGEEKLIGKKGLKVTFSFLVFLKPRAWLKED